MPISRGEDWAFTQNSDHSHCIAIQATITIHFVIAGIQEVVIALVC
jgi:hypothetical protein